MTHGGANTVNANGDDLLLDVWISLKFWNGEKKKTPTKKCDVSWTHLNKAHQSSRGVNIN